MSSLVRAVLLEHRPLLLLVVPFLAVAGPALVAADRPYPLRLTSLWFAVAWLSASVLWLLFCWLRGPRHLGQALHPERVLGALLVATIAVPTQITFQAAKQSIGMLLGFPFDPWLHQADTWLHGEAAWRLLDGAIREPWAIRTLDAAYTGWFVVLFAFVIWLSWAGDRRLRMRALVALLLLWVGAGLLLAAAFPSAGPCYYSFVSTGRSPYAPLLAALDAHHRDGLPLLARATQARLWDVSRADGWMPFVGISAMPSLHVGAAALMAIVGWQQSRIVGIALGMFGFAILAGSVALAWHYAVDGYAGIACAWAAWAGAGLARPRGGRYTGSPLTAATSRR